MLATETRRTVAVVVIALLLAAGAFALLGRAANFHKIVKAARRADKLWFPLCLAGELLAYAGYILAYRDVARADGGPRLRLWSVLRVVVVGFGAFVVGSSAGGLAVDYWALRQAGAGRHESTRRVLALNTIEWAVLGAGAAVAAAAVLLGAGQGAPLPMTLAWLVVVPVCFALALWTTQPSRVDRLSAVPERREGGSLLERARRGIRAVFADAIGGVALVRHLFAHPFRYPAGAAGFAVYWAGDLLTLYAGLRAFGARVDLASLVVAYATSYIATAIPLPAGGAGGIEASLALTLNAVGVPLVPAVLGVLVYRLFSFWLPIVPALAFVPTVKQLRRDVEHAGRAGEDADSARPELG